MTEFAQRAAALDCAVATPVDRHGEIDPARLYAHMQWLDARGVRRFALFGTTGEGTSFPVAERQAALDAVVALGADPRRLIVGTGCPAPSDALSLSRHAAAHGCAACLMLPPYFYRQATAAGLEKVFANVLEMLAAAGDTRLLVYHIPAVSGVALDPDLIDRLAGAYPDILAGVKDSGGDWDYTAALLRRFPDLETYVGSEPHLPRAVANGATGTISGLANVVPALVGRLLAADQGALPAIHALLAAVAAHPLVPAIKALVAAVHDDPGWLHTRLPLLALDAQALATLRSTARLGEAGS